MRFLKTKCQHCVTTLLLVLLVGTGTAVAQVSIAPTALFFNSQSRFSSLTVSNAGQQAQEISISTEFGYPTSRNGNIVIVNDSVMARDKSITGWIRIFPQDFVLEPQQRQVVRFVVRPPGDLPAGGYWARVQISSNPVSPPVESVGEDEVGARINLVVNQIIGAHYHNQGAQTGVEVTAVDFTQQKESETGQIKVAMKQTGNAPFIGSISLTMAGTDGNTVYQTFTTNSVYTNITRTFTVNTAELEPGRYIISGTISPERRDISAEKLLQIEPVSFRKTVTVE